ncbi:UNVERIFIED_CONTAM: hypothetical protein PYX00_009652 [Menopon gallinae]|uniref:SH3 domain-containing protein n=1 Tax=Menopon gallinae TaxID=328185 RepID=A0AAW2HCX7_9NEOP
MFGRDLHLFLIICFVNLFCYTHSDIPRVKLCADPDCSVPISEAQAMTPYAPAEKGVLGFKRGTKITIYSKCREKDGFWFGKIGNKLGYVPSRLLKELTVWKSLDMLNYEISTDNESSSSVGNNSADGINSGTQINDDSGNGNVDVSEKGSVRSPLPDLIRSMSGDVPMPKVNNEPQINAEMKNDNSQTVKVTEGSMPSQTVPEISPINSDVNVENAAQNSGKQESPVEDAKVVDENDDENDVVDDDDEDEEEEEEDEEEDVQIESPSVNDEKLSNVGMEIDNNVPQTVSAEKTDSQMSDSEQVGHVEKLQGEIPKESAVKPDNADVNHIINESSSSDINKDSNDSVSESDVNIKDNGNDVVEIVEGIEESPVIDNSTVVEENESENILKNESVHEDLSSASGTVPAEKHAKLENENLGYVTESVVPSTVSSSSSSSSISSGSTVNLNAADSAVPVEEVSQIVTDGTTILPTPESQFVPPHQQKVLDNVLYPGYPPIPREPGNAAQPGGEAVTTQYTVPVGDQGFENPATTTDTSFVKVSTTFGNQLYTQSFINTPPTYVMKEFNTYMNEKNSEGVSSEPSTEIPPVEATQQLPQTPEYASQTQEYPQMVDPFKDTTHEPVEIPAVVEPVTTTPVPPSEAPTYPSEDGDTDTENDGFLSTLLSWVGFGVKTEEEKPLNQQIDPSEYQKDAAPLGADHKVAPDGTCKSIDGTDAGCEEIILSEDTNSFWNVWMDGKTTNITASYNTFIYLVVTAVTVLIFTLGYYFIEKFRSDGPLIAKVNKLEQELLVSTKECHILKDELANTKKKLNLFETSSNDKTALQLELEEAKKVKSELESNIEALQQELDSATEAGLDLNRMLSEVLTQKGGSETLMESVEYLQSQLNNQQQIIDEMTTKLITKSKENQELQDELTAANEKIESLEADVEDMRSNLNVHLKDNEDVIKELTAKNNELQLKINHMNDAKEKEISKLKKSIGDLEAKLKSASASLKIKDEECNNLKDSMKKIKMKDSKNVDSIFEVSRIKAELAQSQSESNSLKERLKAEEDKVAKLQDNCNKMEEKVIKLEQISAEAEKERVEAQTRLTVLSNYFKEKETQLQKELGLKEAMWVQKQGDESTIFERMKSLEEEIDNYKSQNEALKKEILDQERGLKTQITTLEKKAHENWIAARQAERKLEESKQEAAQLRNKLTLMEKNISNDLESSPHPRVGEEMNGGDALSPLIHDTSSPILFPPPLPLDPNNTSFPPGFIPPPMFMPPPPGGFMPPPPFLPGDHRPPPLGRMSSPPLNNRFSPPPPDYGYDRMSTPPLSPATRNYRSPTESDRDRERFRHRTPTSPSFRSRNWEDGSSGGFRPIAERNSKREEKGGSNLSSGHSSDSLDKSSRHSGRV